MGNAERLDSFRQDGSDARVSLFSDLHIAIHGDLDQALGLIRRTLQHCGAPMGTELVVEETDTVIRIDLN